jgi:hypothetical protein
MPPLPSPVVFVFGTYQVESRLGYCVDEGGQGLERTLAVVEHHQVVADQVVALQVHALHKHTEKGRGTERIRITERHREAQGWQAEGCASLRGEKVVSVRGLF